MTSGLAEAAGRAFPFSTALAEGVQAAAPIAGALQEELAAWQLLVHAMTNDNDDIHKQLQHVS